MDLSERREFLKDNIRKQTDFSRTGQSRGKLPPPVQKPPPDDAQKIKLPGSGEWKAFARVNLLDAIANRASYRQPSRGYLSLAELSFLLWATQGVKTQQLPLHAFRVVPSAGCRHSFETYVAALQVKDINPAIYRYLPLSHELIKVKEHDELDERVTDAALGQSFAGRSAATFIWTTIPSRMEWRYAEASHKVIAIDIGHVGQNLYLACEAVGCGTCAIGAYDQQLSDNLVDVDGEDEFTIYMATVSKK